MFNSAVSMRELELETVQLLPRRETLMVMRFHAAHGHSYDNGNGGGCGDDNGCGDNYSYDNGCGYDNYDNGCGYDNYDSYDNGCGYDNYDSYDYDDGCN